MKTDNASAGLAPASGSRKRRAGCDGCRAFYHTGFSAQCHKGYAQEVRKRTAHTVTYGPAEPCPRPTSNSVLVQTPAKWEIENP